MDDLIRVAVREVGLQRVGWFWREAGLAGMVPWNGRYGVKGKVEGMVKFCFE